MDNPIPTTAPQRVYADGVFDMFHYGHMNYLTRVRAAFDSPVHLIVGICSDETVESYKRKPVMDYATRVQTVRISGFADEIVEAPLKPNEDFINRHRIDYVSHGSDWTEASVDKYYSDAKRLNKLKIVPFTPGISTTDIIERVRNRPDLQDNRKYLTFKDMVWFYPNMIDYLRYILCLIANFTMFHTHLSVLTGILLVVSFLLDIVDGKVARAYKQCSVLGDGIDWGADLYIEVLLMVWWGTLEPTIYPWIVLWTCIEIVAALVDFAIVAVDSYPPRARQTGFCVILEWAIPGGKYSTLGWVNWLSYPHFCVARCVYLSLFASYAGIGNGNIFADLLLITQAILVVPSLLFVWSNAALLISGFARWREVDRNQVAFQPSKKQE